MKKVTFHVLMVSIILFTAVSCSSDGTQTIGPDTELVINTDKGVSVPFCTPATSLEFVAFSNFGYVALFPGNDAILVGANLSFGTEKYFIRGQKLNDLCPAPVFRSTKHFFG